MYHFYRLIAFLAVLITVVVLVVWHHETSAIVLSLVSVLALFKTRQAIENKDKGE
jgi:hypothetical protein